MVKKKHAPVRYFGANNITTDTYYSDLSQIWDNWNNIWMGEAIQIDLPISLWPDLFVGRLLCNNKTEVDNYSNKLHQYTFNPGNGDKSYLKRALYFFSFQYETDGSSSSSSSSSFFDNIYLMDPFEETITGYDIINEINSTKYGFISGFCSGEPQSMWVYDYGYDYGYSGYNSMYLLTALDEIVPSNQCVVDENGNGLDNLTNHKYPAIFYSISPAAISFDNSYNGDCLTLFSNKYNLGESFTLGRKYGGIAFLGFTGMGYREFSFPLEQAFFETMRTLNIYNLGVSESMSKVFYTPNYDYCYHNGRFNTIMTGHNLLGDPEVEMWTNEPQEYNDFLVAHSDNGFNIIGASSADTIAICDNYGHQRLMVGSSNNCTFIEAHPTSTLMIYNHAHIPYIVPMMLQNCEIMNSQYVYASSFSAGKSVLPNNTHGNVTIKSGAVYEIEATGDVHLGEGFIVENGASFAIKTPGKATIDGCVFRSGANVKIEAGNVKILKSFTAERGSKVEITNYVED